MRPSSHAPLPEPQEKVWESMDRIKGGLCIRDGIIIISKSSVLPDGTTI